MLQFIKRCLENKEYCMKNFIKLESIRELEAFHERYIFYDGLVKNIHYDISGKSLSLTLECRDRKEQWLILTILISDVTLVHFYEDYGNQEIITFTLRIIRTQDTSYLLTLDDESMTDPLILQKEGCFVVVGHTVSYHEEYEY